MRSFEDIMTLVGADATFKLLALRRKLKGAANCLTFTIEALSYDGLKNLLLEELTTAEAERMLRRRTWKKNEESLHRYVLEMQKLRRRLDINRFTEAEFVDLIIEGLCESVENTNLLLGTDTVQALKNRMDRYEKVKQRRHGK